jgi:hypothetical protein
LPSERSPGKTLSKSQTPSHQIGRRVGMTPDGLKRYKSVAAVFEHVARELERYYSERGGGLVKRVYEAVEHLKARQIPIEQERIAEIIGLTVNSLKHYGEVKTQLQMIAAQ